MCTYIHIYTHIQTYIHIYTHIDMHTRIVMHDAGMMHAHKTCTNVCDGGKCIDPAAGERGACEELDR